MGEAGMDALRVGFDRTVELEFHGATVSSDGAIPTTPAIECASCPPPPPCTGARR